MYEPVPPVALALTLPSEPPGQLTLLVTAVAEASTAVGSNTVAVACA